MHTRSTGPTYHVLLIGIDRYTVKPLTGCVNDIDAIQRILLGERVRVPEANIIRLASPHPRKQHATLPGEKPATLANIRAALQELGARTYDGDHRVLIYYSGHGMRTPVSTPAGVIHREALVPVDVNAEPGKYRLLFDHELNALLAAITAAAASVTAIFDCCHSAGQMRDVAPPGMTPRALDLKEDFGRDEPLELPPEEATRAVTGTRGIAGSVDDCHVVAACLHHEQAQESRGGDGLTHGLLTRALIDHLSSVPAGEDLRALPWGRIWQGLRAAVETANPAQHLWMAGSPSRAVIAGVRTDGDMGLPVERTGTNQYTIGAGTLAAVTTGAKLAVYGVQPPLFPRLDSDADTKARHSSVLLEVTDAKPASATAKADGTPFDLPPGARARLVKLGKPARLRCAVVPDNRDIADRLAASKFLELVGAGAEVPEVRLRQRAAADLWDLVDDVHGVGTAPVLCSLNTDQLDLAGAVMEQYYFYSLPLRMAAACKDLPGALELSLVRCPKDRALTEKEKDGDLPEAAAGNGFPYELRNGDPIAFRIRNRSDQQLRVALLNAAASGQVQYLGDAILDARTMTVFWNGNTRGKPFPAGTPSGATQGIDRLVVIGTTALDQDLRYLKLTSKFADLLTRAAGVGRDFGNDDTAGPPLELWTATQTVVYTTK